MTIKDFTKIAIVAFIAGSIYLFFVAFTQAVKPEPYKVICHHNPGNEVTLEFANEQAYEGHLGTPHSDTVFDTDGECVEPTGEVTGEPTVTPDLTPDPTSGVSAQLTPTDVPAVGGTSVTNNTSNNTINENIEVVVPDNPPNVGRGR